MDEATQIRDLLLKEYVEAGQISRQHEQLTRTSASVFVPTLLGLAGYVLVSDTSFLIKVVLATAGAVASLLAANVVRRHQLYYRSYINRARAIEAQLKVGDRQIVSLYTDAKSVKCSSCTISSKNAFIAFFLLCALLFLVSGITFFICQRFSAYAS